MPYLCQENDIGTSPGVAEKLLDGVHRTAKHRALPWSGGLIAMEEKKKNLTAASTPSPPHSQFLKTR